jgi:D-alanyl-D-alanine carboxypeptidase
MKDALYVMLVKSANDVAMAIAETVGGSEAGFVAKMNDAASRMGLTATHFANPNGLDNPEQRMSARDLAVLALYIRQSFPQYDPIFRTEAVQLGNKTLESENKLLTSFAGTTGMKTGFVCASGFNVVATATRGGRTLIAVVLGALSGAERTVKAAQLLDEGFGKWGGIGYDVASLPASGTRAPNICDDVRRKGGGAALADDVDVSGSISALTTAGGVGGNADGAGDRFMAMSPQPRATGAMLSRAPSGRIVLGPRAETTPVPVAFGRTAGSASAPLAANATGRPDSQFARGAAPVITPDKPVAASLFGGGTPGLFSDTRPRTASSNGGIPGATTAFAPTGGAAQPSADAFQDGPLKLQGAVQPGKATASSLRPGAAAGIKPAARPPAKPLLAKPKGDSKTDSKSETEKAKPGQAAAKLQPAKPPAKTKATPAPKPKPNDDA